MIMRYSNILKYDKNNARNKKFNIDNKPELQQLFAIRHALFLKLFIFN